MALWDDHAFSARQLQYVLAVAELGGFRKAAEACGVSQPSLSAQVALVEEALGVQIFERNARGMRLSVAGAPIVDRIRQVLVAMQDLRATAQQQGDPLRGTLRIGVIPTVCPYLLPEVAGDMHRELPNLRPIWSEDKTQNLLRQLDEGALDAAVLAMDPRVEDLEHAHLGDDPFVLAGAPDHPLMSDSSPASPAVLDGATVLLLGDGHCFRDQALALCKRAGATEAGLRATGLSTLVQMVGGGSGVTLLPAMAVAVENRRGQLAVRSFTSPTPTRSIVLAWRKGSALRRPLQAVADVLRAAWPATGIV